MLTINDVKSNDFAYFDSAIEQANTRGAVKGAFRYIIHLANLSGTYIDKWDIETVFRKDDKWLTDKAEINKAFFEKKELDPVLQLPIDPETAELLRRPLKEMFAGQTRSLKQNITSTTRNLTGAMSNVANYTSQLRGLNERLMMAEMASSTTHDQALTQVTKVLKNLPYDLWDVTEDKVSFICKADTIVPFRDLPNKINRRFNFGRLIFKINVVDMTIHLERQDIINRWKESHNCHPHYGSYLCYGGFAPDFERAMLHLDLYELMEAVTRWKGTYAAGDALTAIQKFNHHPAFTEYLEGDLYHGMSDVQIYLRMNGEAYNQTFISAPMMSVSEFHKLSKATFGLGLTDSYMFKAGGGPAANCVYEKTRPIEKKLRQHKAATDEFGTEESEEPEDDTPSRLERARNRISSNHEPSDWDHGYRQSQGGYFFYADAGNNEWLTLGEWVARFEYQPDNVPEDWEP